MVLLYITLLWSCYNINYCLIFPFINVINSNLFFVYLFASRVKFEIQSHFAMLALKYFCKCCRGKPCPTSFKSKIFAASDFWGRTSLGSRCTQLGKLISAIILPIRSAKEVFRAQLKISDGAFFTILVSRWLFF